jgi:hypothetical protein
MKSYWKKEIFTYTSQNNALLRQFSSEQVGKTLGAMAQNVIHLGFDPAMILLSSRAMICS